MGEYRHLLCLDCKQKIKIRVTEKSFGKTVIITCPSCKTGLRFNIPVPAGWSSYKEEPPKKDSFPEELEKILARLGINPYGGMDN